MKRSGADAGERRALTPLLLFAPAAALACLRALQIRSCGQQLYSGEAASIGRLQWELAQGAFQFDGLGSFFADYSYQYFAQGTALLQGLAWALSPLFGHTLVAQWAASVLLECCGVFALTWLLSRVLSAPMAASTAVLFVLGPKFATVFALWPYGNHSEFVALPALLGVWLASRPEEARRGAAQAVAVGVGCAALFFAYRLAALPVAAGVVVLAASGSPRRRLLAALVAGSAAVAAAGLFAGIGLRPWGMGDGALSAMLAERPGGHGVGETVAFAWRRGVPAGGPLEGALHRLVLLAAVAAAALCWTPWSLEEGARREVGRFASLWACLAVGFPIVAGAPMGRYFIGAWVAATLCLVLHVGSPRVGVARAAVASVAVLSLLGLVAALGFVAPSTWDRDLPDHDLWFVLQVDTLDADELPFYRRILDDGRGNDLVGRASHVPSSRCPRWPGSGAEAPRPKANHCSGWEAGDLDELIAGVAGSTVDAQARRAALREVGRGVWIRSDRDLERVADALTGVDASSAEAVLWGARDEARRYDR